MNAVSHPLLNRLSTPPPPQNTPIPSQGVLLRSNRFRAMVGLPSMGRMREMTSQIAEVKKVREGPAPGDVDAAAAAATLTLTVPRDPATGRMILLKEDPKKVAAARRKLVVGPAAVGAGRVAVGRK